MNNQLKDVVLKPRLLVRGDVVSGRDAAYKEVVSAEKLRVESKRPGEYRLGLPPDLKVDKDVFVEIVATTPTAKRELRERLQLSRTAYLTHLATDKAMYQPGEQVYFRSLTLNRTSLKPAEEDLRLQYTITSPRGEEIFKTAGAAQVIDERKQPILGPDKKPVRGLGCGSFDLPPESAGGEYALTVSEALDRFPPETRKFIVNKYEKPRLEKKLEFTAKSYGPGDKAVASCSVRPSEGGSVANQPVKASVNIDGKSFDVPGLKTDANGAVNVGFKLPQKIDKGEASLAVTFTDGGNVETLVRPIPIVLNKLLVEFFPEGGDLVAGVPNRCYFQARTTLGKPAELKGHILNTKELDVDKEVVAQVETLNDPKEPGVNQGMGVFEFTPLASGKYVLRIDSPAGINQHYPLPAVKEDGVVLRVSPGVTTEKDPLKLTVASGGKDRSLLVGAYCRGRLLAHDTVEAKAGKVTPIELKPEGTLAGVHRVTVFEDRSADQTGQWTPVAERLTYRTSAERLKLSLSPQRKKFIPGEKVFAACLATNEKDQPQPAVLMVAVVDQSVVNLADEKTHKLMPTHFFLTHEVKKPEDLEFADFMLTDHPKAAPALDLLLGVQGWRRFAEQNPEEFKKRNPEDADRYLVLNMQTPMIADTRLEAETLLQQKLAVELAGTVKEFQPQFAAVQAKIAETNSELVKLQNDPQNQQSFARLQSTYVQMQRAYETAKGSLAAYNRQWLAVSGLAGGIILFIIGVTTLGMGIARRGRRAIPYLVTGVCSLLVVLGVGLAWVSELGTSAMLAVRGGPAAEPDFAEVNADLAVAGRWARDGEGPLPPAGPGGGGGWGMGRGMAKDAPMREARPMPKREAKPEPMDQARPREAGPGFADPNRPLAAAPVPPMAPAAGEPAPEQKALPARGPAEAGQHMLKIDIGGNRVEQKFKIKDKDVDELAKLAERLGDRANKELPAALRQEMVMRRMAAGREVAEGKAAEEMAELLRKAKDADGRAKRFFAPKGGAGGPGAGGLPADGRARAAFEMYQRGGADDGIQLPPAPPLVVREYRHAHSPSTTPGQRTDFAETLCWRPCVVLPDGRGQVDFELSDSVTSFEVLAYGHTLDGRIGAYRGTVESRLPFTVEPKIPIEISAGDKIGIPVTVANDTEEQRPVVLKVDTNGLAVDGAATWTGKVNANQRTRHLFTCSPSITNGEAMIALDGKSEPFASDAIRRTIQVTPEGFPIVVAKSDLLEGVARHAVTMPESWVKGTLKCQVQVYPSTLADLQKGLESLLREPNGCFEQTSSSNYPNLLILDYLRESDQANPELAKRARDLIERGYAKLVSFECQNPQRKSREGYEWFGGTAPPHEALTAYGLLQFSDLSRVYPVDRQMMDRTRDYLHSRRDNKGGFARNPRALDTFGRAPDNITNAYIVWALTETGQESQVDNELATLRDQAKTSKDPYFLALVANGLINRNQNNDALELLQKLAAAQKPDGHLDAERTSITGSGGRDLQIETTSLAILAWLKANRPAEFNNNLQSAIKWLGQQRGGYGGFGATQSTILALKALIAHTKANKKTAEAGELALYVGDQPAGKLAFPAGAQETLEVAIKDADKVFKAGKNDVRVQITGNNSFPHTLTVTYNTIKPASAEGCAVKLETKLDRASANEGEAVRLSATVENISGKGQGMTVAIIGLPAGLTLPEDFKQLKDYTRLQNDETEPGVISAWETRGRELVLYWRDLAPEKKIEVNLDLICRVPGEYRGPASRAYLYYNADTKHWIDPLKIEIKAKE